MTTIPMSAIRQTLKALILTRSWKATKYISRTTVVRATRRVYNRKIDGRDNQISVVLTLGRPNYQEAEFIKAALRADEPFPVRKVQLRPLPKRRAA